MRGWQMSRTGEPVDVLTLDALPDPVPGSGELLIDVECAGLSFADSLLIRGDYQIALPLPCVPGSEFVGRVAASSTELEIPVGARVIGISLPPAGAFAERCLARADQCEPIPEHLSGPEAVCLIGNYVTAHLALHRRARLQEGEVVVVHGAAGGVGSAAVQIAKAAGARVIAADLGADRVAGCRDSGADIVVDVSDPGRLAEAVAEDTGGRGVDVVVDMVGGELFEAARRFIAYEGRLVVVGFTSGVIPVLRMNQLLLRSFAVLGVNALTVLQEHPDVHKEARRAVVQLLSDLAISPPVGAVVALAELVETSTALAAQQISGKAVVEIARA